jgi:CRP-like cAMP-binding protein
MQKNAQIKRATKVQKKRMPKAIRAFVAPPAVCDELRRIGNRQAVKSGTILFEAGEQNRGLFVVNSGRFALSSGDDPVRVTRIAESGSLLGLPATVRDAPYSLTAEAVNDSEVWLISPADFRHLLTNNPTVGMAVLSILAEEVFAMRRTFVFSA